MIRGFAPDGAARVATPRGERSVPTDALRRVRKEHEGRVHRSVGSAHATRARKTRDVWVVQGNYGTATAGALGGGSAPSRTPPPHARFTVHGARRGVNKVEHVDTPAKAGRVARALANKDFLVTVFTRDPHTQETRVVLHSNRDEAGRMKFTVMDESFARAARVRR